MHFSLKIRQSLAYKILPGNLRHMLGLKNSFLYCVRVGLIYYSIEMFQPDYSK